jgi:hypothetical protein
MTEIDSLMVGGDDVVARALAARVRSRELDALAADVNAMIQHVIATHPDAVRGTELDPAQLRGKREKLIARAAELLPKQAVAPEAGVDLAAQLKRAMQQNAFGDLRFSGRDPVEVMDELRASWTECGPIDDDDDREQLARFEDTVERVLEAAGAKARPPRDDRPSYEADGDDRSGRRRRRDRRSAEQPVAEPAPGRMRASDEIAVMRPPIELDTGPISTPDHAASDGESPPDPIEEGPTGAVPVSIPLSAHDAITLPVVVAASEAGDAPDAPAVPEPVAPWDERSERMKSASIAPPVDELDTGWDLGDEDPTAGSEPPEPPEVTTPSSSEMAGDGAVEGDGLDTGWD